jgi:hypothetical protein
MVDPIFINSRRHNRFHLIIFPSKEVEPDIEYFLNRIEHTEYVGERKGKHQLHLTLTALKDKFTIATDEERDAKFLIEVFNKSHNKKYDS